MPGSLVQPINFGPHLPPRLRHCAEKNLSDFKKSVAELHMLLTEYVKGSLCISQLVWILPTFRVRHFRE